MLPDAFLGVVFGLSLVLQGKAKSVRLHHRFHHPSAASTPFTLKATIDTSGPSLDHSVSATADIHAAGQSVRGVNHALYQVALEPDGFERDWVISSVKACHLMSATSDSIVLYLSSSNDIYNLDYFVSPVPHDGSCLEPLAEASPVLSNTTVHLVHPKRPPLPELRIPPPVTPQGQVVQPEPEQSFLQKYWMYIAGALVVMFMTPSPPEEGEGARQGGGATAPRR